MQNNEQFTSDEIRQRREAIQTISALFPPDAEYSDTAAVGQRLLEQARRECAIWKNEPTPVLRRFAQLCEAEESRPVAQIAKGQR